MNIAICDDDKKYLDILEGTISSYFLEKDIPIDLFFYDSGETIISSDVNFDIVFIDIEMNKVNGIQATKFLKEKNKDTIVFIVTAFQNYLDDAMDLDVFRYISKPIDKTRIVNGLDTALELINSKVLKIVDVHSNLFTISAKDIIYIESKMRKTYIYLIDREIVTKKSLSYFKDKLNAYFFVAPHNSYIVNFNCVKSFSRTNFVMTNNHTVPISQKKQPEIKKLFFRFVEGKSNG